MASLINSLRNISSDSFWAPKLAFLSFFIFIILDNKEQVVRVGSAIPLLSLFIIIIFMGCASVMMNRNINNKSPLLPGLFSFPEVFVKSIGCTISMIPGTVIYVFCISYIQKYLIFETFVMIVIYSCVTLFFLPFICIPAVLYSVNGKLKDAFRFDIIFAGSGNFVVQVLSYIIQYFFIIFLFAYLLYKLFVSMLGEESVFIPIVYSITIVVSFLSFFSFCADLYDDVIPPLKSKRDIF